MLKIIEANEKYINQYQEAYYESLKQIKLGTMKKHNMMFIDPDTENIINHFKDNRDQSKLPSYYVPSFDYFAVDGDKFIGIIHIRIRLTKQLLQYGGHIGYAINPKYWNKGYGKELLKIGLIKAKKIIEDEKILITCDDDNIGSYKIIEANGGILENKVYNIEGDEKFLTRRYWINK